MDGQQDLQQDVQQMVRSHYSREGLAEVVLDAVAASGADPERLTPQALGSVDQLHLGGAAATAHLLGRLELGPGTPLLDVGGGLGGPARAAAAGHGCPVVSVDLSPDFVQAARALTDRVGLGDRVEHRLGSAEQLDLETGRFSAAMMIHVGMNLPDKPAVFAEVRRVLADGGVFGLFEQVRTGPGALTYPLPWAEAEGSSFLVDLDTLTGALRSAGFEVEEVEDRSAAVPEIAARTPGPPPLSPAAVFGPGFVERLRNDVAAIRAGSLAPVVVLARAV
ncbi:Methyltransferase domain-containing protein [Friedmanniella luteola]|uniref:Methyltransferase domain-containing protein n=1 Tax=Friedmanniella luteola TaxID=546871 RepID=A0A1H1ZF32_9ACTN|nr:class I SAM-dependent methyltransferase [Friedmanniella luteola]SDT32253.1 Methyltransferase domain-containing protein [Friedmanniella luteola]